MNLFRRKKPSWPPELERRQPQNGEQRDKHERDHRAWLATQAQQAAEETAQRQPRIDRLEDIARWIELSREA